MLFNSYVFIFAFLPVTVIVYFLLNRFRYVFLANCWLALSSLLFYSWWNISYLPLILGSIVFNYTVARLLQGIRADSSNRRKRKTLLVVGISGNIGLLGYYKYADFFLTNLSGIVGQDWPLLKLLLPLGISFFTFTQLAYLVDTYKNKATENFLPSEVDKALGGHTLKLSMRGSTSDEQFEIAALALQTGKVKSVIWGIDYFALKKKSIQDDDMYTFPDYLYDDYLLNDYNYWFSFSIYKQFAMGIAKKLIGTAPDSVEYLYNWITMSISARPMCIILTKKLVISRIISN